MAGGALSRKSADRGKPGAEPEKSAIAPRNRDWLRTLPDLRRPGRDSVRTPNPSRSALLRRQERRNDPAPPGPPPLNWSFCFCFLVVDESCSEAEIGERRRRQGRAQPGIAVSVASLEENMSATLLERVTTGLDRAPLRLYPDRTTEEDST